MGAALDAFNKKKNEAAQGQIGGEPQGFDQNAPNYSASAGAYWAGLEQDAQRQDAATDKAAAAAKAAAAKAEADNKFNYGGEAGKANADADYYRQNANNAQGRQGEHVDTTRSDQDRQNANEDRGKQLSVADMMLDRASGKTPSIAGMRADQDIRTLTAGQTSLAASARGPAALALAQKGAANNTAQGTSQISSNAQINSAQERSDAEKSAFGAFSGVRTGDFQAGGLAQQSAQKQAEVNAAQRAENDRYSQSQNQNEIEVRKAQLAAQGNQVGIATGAAQAQAARDQAAGFHSDDNTWKAVGTGAAIAAPIVGVGLGALLGGGGKGSGQPGQSGAAGEPDLSGEEGYHGSMEGYTPTAGSSDNGGGGYVPPDDINSDMRLKQGINSEGDGSNRVDDFLDGIHPLSYTYKNPADEPRNQPTGGRYLGISAQDLEAVPEVGKQMVSEGPRGNKRVESGPTLSAALAGLARLHERVKDIENGTKEEGNARLAQGPAVGGSGDAEASRLQRSGAEMEASNAAAQRAMLDAGPSVGQRGRISDADARRLLAQAGEMQAQTRGQHALLDEGPSVRRAAYGPTLADGFTSDIRAKGDVESEGNAMTEARRQAFTEGLAHANEARDTGLLGQAPSYMDERRAGVVKQQPFGESGNAHGKASGSYGRQDGAVQQRYNGAVQADREHALLASSVPSMGDPFTMGSKLAGADRLAQLDADNERRKPRTFTPNTPSLASRAMSYADAAPDAMSNALGSVYDWADPDPRMSGGR